jgi:hypothetical protein
MGASGSPQTSFLQPLAVDRVLDRQRPKPPSQAENASGKVWRYYVLYAISRLNED